MANLKALIVVLGISMIAFLFLKPIALRFTAEADFNRRRNLWLTLTCIGFLVPNIWLYILVAGPLLLWAARKDSNPVALYLVLLHVLPPVTVMIPFPGIAYLFDASNYRLLALCILIPTILRLRADKAAQDPRGLQSMDLLLLAFGVLQTVLFVRPDAPGALLLRTRQPTSCGVLCCSCSTSMCCITRSVAHAQAKLRLSMPWRHSVWCVA